MKKYFILLIIISFAFLLFSFWTKQEGSTNLKTNIPELTFSQEPINFNLSIDYQITPTEKEKQEFNLTNEKTKSTSFIQVGKCSSFVNKPDDLSNKLKNQGKTKNDPENNLYQIDCGIIQTSFPLSF